MVYKKFIKRDGKVFGPYYYESYRDSKGNVKTRFVSGPKIKDKTPVFFSKKMLVIFGIIFTVTLLLFFGNLSYNTRTTGKVVDSPSFSELEIAEQIADNSISSNVDVRNVVNLEVKEVPDENNKIIEFLTPNGKIVLNFDLLNYSKFVKSRSEDTVYANGFDIDVDSSPEKYKWGYNVELTDLNFMARIDVSTNQSISVIDNQTIRIGDAYLSFADLSSQGYTLSINEPANLNVNESFVLSNESIILNETNVSWGIINVTIENESEVNISSNVSIILNESVENITVQNESEGVENISFENETEIESDIVDNENASEDSSLDNNREVLVEDSPKDTPTEQTPEENIDIIETPVNEDVFAEESPQTSQPTVTEEAISSISGFVVHGFKGLTGFVVNSPDTENTVSIYVQRNFSGTNHNIGETINLDPSLIFFEQDITYSMCYQETANQSTVGDGSCGLNYTGSYDATGFWNNLNNTYDGNWSTMGLSAGGFIYINYTKPLGAQQNSLWQIHDLTTSNLTISQSCWDYDSLKLQLRVAVTDTSGEWDCNNGTWSSRRIVGMGIGVYEEAMIWNISNSTSTSLSSCQNINQSGVYTMTQSLSGAQIPATGCFNITVSNVTLDCNGYYIKNTSLVKPAIYAGSTTGISNITVKNCNISVSQSTEGIWFDFVSNSFILNNLFVSDYYGITLDPGSNNNLIINNSFYSSSGEPLALYSSRNNQFINNTFNSTYFAFTLYSSVNNSFINTIINNCTDSIIGCIYLYNSSDNSFSSGRFNYSTGSFIYLDSSSNNSFSDINISSAASDDFYIDSSAGIILVNTSYGSEYVSPGSSLTKKWYYRTYVNDSSGNPVSSANVTAYNTSGGFEFNILTNSSGWTNITTITEYTNNGTKRYFSNYTINITASSYSAGSHPYNVTLLQNNNLNDIFTLTPISSCRIINQSGIYNQTSNIVPPAGVTSCINITTSNVTYDCGGKRISNTSLAATGIYAYNVLNVTIKNCNITMNDSSGGYGIWFNQVNNSFIINNTVNLNYGGIRLYSYSNNNYILNNTANNNGAFGIRLYWYNNNNTITNAIVNNNNYGLWIEYGNYNNASNINASNDRSYAVALEVSDYNSLTNITVSTPSQDGLYIFDSDNNIVSNVTSRNNQYPIHIYGDNNTISDMNLWNCTYAYTNAGCLYVGASNNNTFSRGIINFSSGNLINLYAGRNNQFYDLTLIGASKNDTKVFIGALNNTFINISYNSSKEYVESGSQLIRKWYYSTYVNDSFGNAVSGANLSIYNSSGDITLNRLTNSSGWTGIAELNEYVNDGDNLTGINRSYSTPHLVYASKNGVGIGSKILNISSSFNVLNDTITIGNNLSSCTKILSPGTYSLSGNIIGAMIPETGCFNITTSNVVFDCRGYYILNTSTNYSGIYAGSESGLTNVTIKNCNITMSSSSGGYGIWLNQVNNSFVINNTVESNLWGIYLQNSSNNTIGNNRGGLNFLALILTASSLNNISYNNFSGQSYMNLGADLYFTGHGIGLSQSNFNTVHSNNLSEDGYGIEVVSSVGNNVTNNSVNVDGYGIVLTNSTRSLVSGNAADYNYVFGIILQVNASNNTVINNSATNNLEPWEYNGVSRGNGITISTLSNYNNITNNNASSNLKMGVYVYLSERNNLSGNNISLNRNGIEVDYSYYNLVEGGSIINNIDDGITLYSNGYTFFDNVFVNTTSDFSGDGMMWIFNSSNNSFSDMSIDSNGSIIPGFYSGSVNNTFLNVTFNSSREYVESGSSLIRRWYYSTYVNDSIGTPITFANVTAYNSSNVVEFSSLTNERTGGPVNPLSTMGPGAEGWTGLNEITEYKNTGNTTTGINRTYASNYTIFAKKAGVGIGNKIFNLTSFGTNVLNDSITINNNLTSCAVIDIPGVFYLGKNLLGAQIPSTGCFNITVSNVSLDCQNRYIFNSSLSVPGIYAGNVTNVTVRNCNVTMGSNGRGIYLKFVNNSFINNNTANSNQLGIYFDSSSNNQIINNTAKLNTQVGINFDSGFYNNISENTINLNLNGISVDGGRFNILSENTVNSNSNVGISISSSTYNNISENTANSNSIGIFLLFSSRNIFLNNNLWNCTTSLGCIDLTTTSTNNSFFGGVINFSEGYLIYLESNSDNNLFRDLVLINSTKNDTSLFYNSINNTFINVSYNSSKEFVEGGSSLVRSWYYQAYVNHTDGGAVNNANLYAANSSGNYVFNTTTNSSGWIPIQALTQYINNGTLNYVDIYLINVTNITDSDGHYYNVSLYGNNFFDYFTANDTSVPYIIGLSNSYVCEGEAFSLKFNVSDIDWDISSISVSPQDPFYGRLSSTINMTLNQYEVYSGVLNKAAAGGANNRSKIHNLTVSLYDGVNTNSTQINVTVIETNEQPSMENFDSSYTVYSGDRFYHQVLVNDSEDGNESSGRLYFNMTITGGNITDINSSGVINFTANSSILGTYTFEVCATDKGLSNPSPNISLCLNGAGNKTTCKSFVLNIVERTNDGGSGGNRGGGGGGGGNSLNNGPKPDSSEDGTEEENIYLEENSTFEVPNPFCGNWTPCRAVYNLSEVIENKVFFRGEQRRECKLADGDIHVETRSCSSKVNIIVKRKEDCFKDYLVVLDSSNTTLSRLEFVSGDKSKLNIQLLMDKSAYCPYCYDFVKDYDETGIDCGGPSCAACVEHPIRVYSNFSEILFFIIIVGVLVCGNIAILLFVRYHLLKAQINEVREASLKF